MVYIRRRVILIFMLALSLGFVAGSPSPVSAAEKPDKGGIIVWAVHESMPSFDMHYDTSYILAQPVGPIYNGLVTQDPYNNGKIVGDLAERWEISEDGKRITFFLHKGVKFHDGSDFSCADAQYTMDKLADRKRTHPTFVTVVEEVYDNSSCTDDYTLVVSLKRPSAALMTLLSGAHAAMMKKGIAEMVDRKDPKFLVGTGPFKFKSYTPGVDFQGERNPNYWKPGLPHIEGYRAVVMSDLTKIFASFRARQLTMTGIGRHLERPEAEILKRDFPDAVVAIGPRATWDNFIMNVSKPPFNDIRVRKAVALATDREKMIEIAVEGWGLLGGFIGPHTPFALPTEELLKYPQFGPDMQKRQAEAKRLLAEAGYANGLDVELMLRRGPLYERGALSRQDDLKKVGINVKISLVDTAANSDRQKKSDFQANTAPAAVHMDDPDLYYARFTCGAPSNYGKYCNPEFDKLFDEQSRTFDVEKRAEITRKMERILLEDIPDDRGYYWKSSMGYWNRVQNWPPLLGTTVYNYGKFEQVWCQSGRCM
ncbi:MAG TPA: ABC transporter substrate-binding protein [Alphaproteobacteria bacterium]|nr:ABC transporter substrate-binding protein [Alphaproteobacteria bacterium]